MKLMVAMLLAGAVLVGGIYWYGTHRDRCSSSGFGVLASVKYCQRPDGSVYLDGVPTPTPEAVESTG